MKRFLGFLMLALSIITPVTLKAVTTYNSPITAIFGGGNPNNGWTIDTVNIDAGTSIELGLRFKYRDTGFVSTYGGNVYYSDPGFSISGASRTKWNVEWSVNADKSGLTGKDMLDYTFVYRFDTDPSITQNWVTFNPMDPLLDNSYGNNATLNGAGVEDFSPGAHSLGQNSHNGGFFPYLIDATQLNGIYDVMMTASPVNGGDALASVSARLIVGEVPETSTYGAGAVCIAGVVVFTYRKQRSKTPSNVS